MAQPLADQSRWNDVYGVQQLRSFEQNPDAFLLDSRSLPFHNHILLDALPDLAGKRVLDLGSGRGEISMTMASRGASVVGIDIGPALVDLANRSAAHNRLDAEFVVGSVDRIPFSPNSFDLVVGCAFLHHLSEQMVQDTIDESYRVVRPGGSVHVIEPIENSKVFDLLQNLFPVGKPGQPQYRPSILQRSEWAEFLRTLDERPLTDRELTGVGSRFERVELQHHGMTARLSRLLPNQRLAQVLDSIDARLTHRRSPLRRFSRMLAVEYCKQ